MRLFPSVGRDVASPFVFFHHFLHEADVVILRKISVFEQVRAFVLWHCLHKMFDDFIRDERVSKIQFCDIGLWEEVLAGSCASHQVKMKNIPCHLQPP